MPLTLPRLLTLTCACLMASASAQPLAESAIAALLATRLQETDGTAMVAGVIDRQGRRFFSVGTLKQGDARRADGHTLFKIGSVTKVFTSLLLADMVVKGEVALDDPVQKHLPADVAAPQRDGQPIRLVHLSTHRSGLPRDAGGSGMTEANLQKLRQGTHQLHAFVSSSTLANTPGKQFGYSNLGVALLGDALARRAGMGFESLMQERILAPLGLADTRFTLDAPTRQRRAQGYEGAKPVAQDDIAAFAAQGGLYASADELLTLLGGALGLSTTPLDRALAFMKRPDAGAGDLRLGWLSVSRRHGSEIWSHPGGGEGYSAVVAFDALGERGVVLLSNGSRTVPIDLAHHLLNRRHPLLQVAPPAAFRHMLEASGYREVLPAYRALRHRDPQFHVRENIINDWGGSLLAAGRTREAIELLAFNVQQHPRSANAHDSLAQAHEKAGDKAAAIAGYRQALALDPKFSSAVERLAILAP